jgi:uncharacterized protein YeaO (DUF488 family)
MPARTYAGRGDAIESPARVAVHLLEMTIRTRRWNDPEQKGDGLRVLVCRYRPRGLRKEDETWDVWLPDLGPSRELHAGLYGKHGPPIGWREYRRRYLAEIRDRREVLEQVAEKLRTGTNVTLLCSSTCHDPAHCHRTLLAKLLEKASA